LAPLGLVSMWMRPMFSDSLPKIFLKPPMGLIALVSPSLASVSDCQIRAGSRIGISRLLEHYAVCAPSCCNLCRRLLAGVFSIENDARTRRLALNGNRSQDWRCRSGQHWSRGDRG